MIFSQIECRAAAFVGVTSIVCEVIFCEKCDKQWDVGYEKPCWPRRKLP